MLANKVRDGLACLIARIDMQSWYSSIVFAVVFVSVVFVFLGLMLSALVTEHTFAPSLFVFNTTPSTPSWATGRLICVGLRSPARG